MIFYYSKRLFYGLFFIFGLIGLSIYIGFYIDMTLLNRIVFITISTIVLLILSYNVFKHAYNYFKSIPAIILNKDYLIDNINQQKICWSDIFQIVHEPKNKRVIIVVGDINKEKYLLSKTGLSKKIWKVNLDITNGSFWIPTMLVRVKAIELFKILEKYLQLENEKNHLREEK